MSLSRIQELLATATACEGPLGESVTLPSALFSDHDWFEAERLAMQGQWTAVCRSNDVSEPGSFVAVDVLGEPVAIVRGRDQVLRALSNVCRHRSMTILEGSGSTPSLQCPYHLWTYKYDGSLLHAPSMEQATDFATDAICLPQFSVDEWNGWILVSLVAPGEKLTDSSPTLSALLTEHRVAEMVRVATLPYPSPWNWKISIENFLESYHHRGVHPQTLETSFPGVRSFVPDPKGEPWAAIDHESVVEGFEPFVAIVAFPTLMFAIVRGIGLTWFKLEPLSVEETLLTIEVFVLPEFAEEQAIIDVLTNSTVEVNAEDIPVNRRTAAGLRSRFAEQGRISHLEEATWIFRKWLLSLVRGVN